MCNGIVKASAWSPSAVNPPWQDCWDSSARPQQRSLTELSASPSTRQQSSTQQASTNQDAPKVTGPGQVFLSLCRYGCCDFLSLWKKDRGKKKPSEDGEERGMGQREGEECPVMSRSMIHSSFTRVVVQSDRLRLFFFLHDCEMWGWSAGELSEGGLGFWGTFISTVADGVWT